MKKRIRLLATGGTIASGEGAQGLRPSLSAREVLAYLPGLDALCDAEAEDILFLDSSNIQPEEWRVIARACAAALEDCDGVVVTHGTDTMAYTAAILSFMLQGLQKPVILTGSQLPITHLMSDGRTNLANAFAAACAGHPGVYVVFNNRIIAGTRAFKVRSMGFDAFRSVNAPYAGEVDARGVRMEHPLPVQPGPLRLLDRVEPAVCLIKLIPGTNPALFDALIPLGYRGVVVEAFGVGGFHYLRRNLLPRLETLHRAGVVVLVTSQCLYDATDLPRYETGARLSPGAAVAAGDMTTEAAVTKLMWALGQTADPCEVERILLTPLCGEIRGAASRGAAPDPGRGTLPLCTPH